MKMILTTLVLFTLTASAEDEAPPFEPYILTLMPHFLELWKNFDTLDECKTEGVELANSADIFNGYICEQGRAWIPEGGVAVYTRWVPRPSLEE